MVQTHRNNIFWEVGKMDSPKQTIDGEKNVTIKVERIFTGEKTAKELMIELLKKRRDKEGPQL